MIDGTYVAKPSDIMDFMGGSSLEDKKDGEGDGDSSGDDSSGDDDSSSDDDDSSDDDSDDDSSEDDSEEDDEDSSSNPNKKEDKVKTTGSSSWSLKIQIGMFLDCTLQDKGVNQGKYYFSNFIIVAGCTLNYKKQWEVSITGTGVILKIDLKFSIGKLKDGSGSGVRWHFYRDPDEDTPLYLTENSTINVLGWNGTKSKGIIGFRASIGATIEAEYKGILTVGGSIGVELENNVTYDTVKGWDDVGAVFLSPSVYVKLTFLKIPLWSTTYSWHWGNTNVTQGKPHPPTDDEIQADILFNKTSDREIVDYTTLYGDRSGWGGSTFMRYAPGKPSSTQDITEKVLQTGFYQDGDIRIADLGNGKYLATFIDLVPGRATADAFGAYYSVYNGSTWSIPQLLEDDGTADDVPTVCNAGSKGWLIVWSDASRLLDENENVGDILNTYDLTGRFFDPETNTLGDVMEITKTGGTDLMEHSATGL